ncbi:MAG: hypothetical protein H6734_02745 [Alphaproteobacteria bacterium]|nr:hypothetical protein [Alphaproteobacteria bacterium]
MTRKQSLFSMVSGAALAAGLALGAPAFAEDAGVPVTIEVRDAATDGVVSTAVVRHPKEAERHRVNADNGRWTENVLYMADGSELLFEKGMVLTFEVSAPGYKNHETSLLVRKRRNLHIVHLEKMELTLDEEFENEPGINFDRDVPLDK